MSRTDKDRKRKHLPENERPDFFRCGGDWRGMREFAHLYYIRPDRRKAKRACQLHEEHVEQYRHRARWDFY